MTIFLILFMVEGEKRKQANCYQLAFLLLSPGFYASFPSVQSFTSCLLILVTNTLSPPFKVKKQSVELSYSCSLILLHRTRDFPTLSSLTVKKCLEKKKKQANHPNLSLLTRIISRVKYYMDKITEDTVGV